MSGSVTAAVLLALLGATLSGAWRASQPRLQFTHSGKTEPVASLFILLQVFQAFRWLLMSDASVAPLHTHNHSHTSLFSLLLMPAK